MVDSKNNPTLCCLQKTHFKFNIGQLKLKKK